MVAGPARFTPGGSTAVVAPWFAALVDASVGSPLVRSLAALVEEPEGTIDDLVETLTTYRLRDLPAFAIALRSATATEVLIRGAVTVTIGDAAPIVGTAMRTWLEHSVPGCHEVGATLGTADPAGTSGNWALLGVIPAVAIEWSVSADDAITELLRLAPAPTPVPGTGSGPFAPVPEPIFDDPASGDSDTADADAADADPDGADTDSDVVAAVAAPQSQASDTLADFEFERLAELDDPEPDSVDPEDEDEDDTADADAAAEPVTMDGASAGADDPYSHLWGATQVRPIPAARRDDAADKEVAPSVDGAAPSGGSDHDGRTQSVASVRDLVARAQANGPAGDVVGGIAASRCPAGHLNPPMGSSCRVCGVALLDGIEMVHRPPVGVIVLPDGERVDVDRTVAIGRSPQIDGLFEGDPPRLISRVHEHEMSRTHVVFEVSGWTATVTDKSSKNGTVLHLPGRDPQAMRAEVPVTIVPGAEIILAESVTLRFEAH